MKNVPSVTEDELERFLVAPAPRMPPPSLRKAALNSAASGSTLVIILVFLVMGLIFASNFFPRRLLDQRRLDHGATVTAPGRIIEVHDTGMLLSGGRVTSYQFEFTTADGRTGSGFCFYTGRPWEVDAAVEVRHVAGDPGVACVEGARLEQLGATGLLMLLFPLLVSGALVWWVLVRRRAARILTRGEIGEFRVESLTETKLQVNRCQQFEIVLRRVDGGASSSHRLRWHHPEWVAWAKGREKSGRAVAGLLDPAGSERIMLPEVWLKKRA